jgi:uncharacterized protein YdhG (YjbR/CyaY superfamily)
MARTDYASVADYLATQPPKARRVLEQVRRALGRAIPRAAEAISYQIPALSVDGVAVIYFAGWKDHYAVYPVGERVAAALGAEIAPYKASKGTLRFSLDVPVPVALLTSIARLRAEEVADIVAARRARKATKKLQRSAAQAAPARASEAATKATPKKAAKKATPKKATPRKAAKKTTPKEAAKKTTPKEAAKKTTPKEAAKKTTPRKAAKETTPKKAPARPAQPAPKKVPR